MSTGEQARTIGSAARAALALGLVPLALGGTPAVLAQPNRPPLPSSRVQEFNSDEGTCRPEAITTAYRQHLQPWAEQPPQVLERLRQLQLEMTTASLQRCVQKGLLSAEQAAAIDRQLGLSTAPAAPASSGTRP